MELDTDLRSIQEVRNLLRRADDAHRRFMAFSQEEVDRVVESMARAGLAAARELAEDAVAETGFGRVDDKIVKNTVAARNVWESIRPLRSVGVVREDKTLGIVEIAVPMGVVAGIVPSTNPTSTTIFKSLISLKGRNAVVFSPHPSARRCIGKAADIMHDAAVRAGAPPGLVGCVSEPTLDATRELMHHPLTAVILATGGHAMVKAAYSSGKPAFGVGPGNVPAFIERTADIPAAVEMVLAGKCFDNGTICASEQSVVVDAPVEAEVCRQLARFGAWVCSAEEKKLLEKTVVKNGGLNAAIVGRSACRIASMAGFRVPEETTALVARLEEVGAAEPLSMEKLSPILGFYVVDGWQEGCRTCIRILGFGGMGHSLSIHSRDEEIIRKFAEEKPVSRILANTSSTHGAIGYSSGLAPSLTLGCGAWGGNITSDNVTALHLVNIKRLAYGIRPVEFTRGRAMAESPASPGLAVPSPQTETAPAAVRPAVTTAPAPVAAPAPPAADGQGVDRQAVRDLVEAALKEVLQGERETAPAKPPAGGGLY